MRVRWMRVQLNNSGTYRKLLQLYAEYGVLLAELDKELGRKVSQFMIQEGGCWE